MSAGTFNLQIEQGATYYVVLIWSAGSACAANAEPVDLTGYTAELQIRPFPLSTSVLYDATPNLTLGGVNGTITLEIPAANTAGFTWWNGVYDLKLTSSQGFATRLLQGSVSVSPEVSQ